MAQFKYHGSVGTKEDVSSTIEAMLNPKPWVEPEDEMADEIEDLNAEIEELKARIESFENETMWPVRLTAAAWEEIKATERKLDALEAAGVDNWEGYSEAMQSLREDVEDADDA